MMTANPVTTDSEVVTQVVTQVVARKSPYIRDMYSLVTTVTTKQRNASLRAGRSTNTIGLAGEKHVRGLSFHRGVIFSGDSRKVVTDSQKRRCSRAFLGHHFRHKRVTTGRFTYPISSQVVTKTSQTIGEAA